MYMQSTISETCTRSRLRKKSLSSMALMISSLDLWSVASTERAQWGGSLVPFSPPPPRRQVEGLGVRLTGWLTQFICLCNSVRTSNSQSTCNNGNYTVSIINKKPTSKNSN